VVEWVEVRGAYLPNFFRELADGLNCIIGGTGAGKTTVLELLLFALGVSLARSRAAAHDAMVPARSAPARSASGSARSTASGTRAPARTARRCAWSMPTALSCKVG
jgi:hypothetical protein